MFIARQLKQKNIAEYLLYMWQVEDLLRANGLDMEKIKRNIVDPYPLDEAHKAELAQWYEELINMMHLEGTINGGHLQINKNILLMLTDLHLQLLRSPKFPFYTAAYYKALPFIVELRAKSGKQEVPELETCFDALYGVMILRLQKRPVSSETEKAVGEISSFLSLLANYYDKERKGELEKLLAD